MSSMPKIPKEQRAFAGQPGGVDGADLSDRRDSQTEVRSGQPGDADVNTKEQGRFGNMNQNLTPIRNIQDR